MLPLRLSPGIWRCLIGLAIAGALGSGSARLAEAADDKPKTSSRKAAGILIDKNEKWLTVKADGEDEAVKYLLDADADKKLIEALKSIFNASRVQLTYKSVGDERRLVSIQKATGKKSGTVTGTVVKVYNDFWVEVKPKQGPPDAFAPGANYKDPKFMALLRGLKPGESVTIKFYTDFERHRIESLRKNPTASPAPSAAKATGKNAAQDKKP